MKYHPGKTVTDYDWATCTGKINGHSVVFLETNFKKWIEWECYPHKTSTWDKPSHPTPFGSGATMEEAALDAKEQIELIYGE